MDKDMEMMQLWQWYAASVLFLGPSTIFFITLPYIAIYNLIQRN